MVGCHVLAGIKSTQRTAAISCAISAALRMLATRMRHLLSAAFTTCCMRTISAMPCDDGDYKCGMSMSMHMAMFFNCAKILHCAYCTQRANIFPCRTSRPASFMRPKYGAA